VRRRQPNNWRSEGLPIEEKDAWAKKKEREGFIESGEFIYWYGDPLENTLEPKLYLGRSS